MSEDSSRKRLPANLIVGGSRTSIVARQAVTSTLFMVVAIIAMAVAATAAVGGAQRADLLATIDTDIAGLVDGLAAGGIPEVKRRIEDRSVLLGPSDAAYLLLSPDGKRLAGGLDRLPALDAALSQAGDLSTSRGPVLARSTLLPGDYTLVVARSLEPTIAITKRLARVFAIATLPAAAMSLAVGWVVARRLGTRVTRLDNVMQQFAAGQHAARSDDGGRDELAQLAASVDEHLAQTQRLIQAQRQISENIAHELRTPLGHLDARLIRVIETSEDSGTMAELQDARSEIRMIVSLFDALLDLALAETIDRSADSVFDLSERLGELAELYDASADATGVAFTYRIAPGVTMAGEPMAMTRAVANLLDNAFKFTSPGDQIRLSLRSGPRIAVEDDGPGVTQSSQARLFERFEGERIAGRGHGLGLALVRVIAARHGLLARYEDACPGARFIIEPVA